MGRVILKDEEAAIDAYLVSMPAVNADLGVNLYACQYLTHLQFSGE